MSSTSFQLHGRISRRDLAKNPQVWWTFVGLYGIIALSVFLIPLLWPGHYTQAQLWPFAALCAAVSIIAALSEPPAMDTWKNHLVILSVPVLVALGVIAFRPTGMVPLPAAIFVGSFSAGRLQGRRQLLTHFSLVTVILLAPLLVVHLDRATVLGLLSMLPAVWVLAFCVSMILDSAESQGEELERLVRRDPLTGVGNRRLLSERLVHEIHRTARTNRPFSVLALDLNGFKELNDRVGHDAGDALLQRIARTLHDTVRAQDTVVRQGGDEFCVLLPETTAEQAAGFAATVHEALAALPHDAVPVETGIGIATFPTDAPDGDGLLAVADSRLAIHKVNARTASLAATRVRSGQTAAASPVASMSSISPLPPDRSAAATRFTRVSRRGIAVSRLVWVAFGGMLAFFAVGVSALYLLGPGAHTTQALVYCVALAAVAALTLATEPPRMNSWRNHLVVATPYAGATLFLLAMPGYASCVFGAFAFTGPLVAVRLADRRAIVAHYALATAMIAGVVASGTVSVALSLSLFLTALAIWGAGFGDVIYLEEAEKQGDELEQLVRRDPLTGAGNRRLLSEQLDYELRRHARIHRPLTVFALDLNGFKALNDALGHAAGDELLKKVADAIRATVRVDDTVVRQGGDEFCVLLPETGADVALPIANAIRSSIASLGAGTADRPVTTGLGMATFSVDATAADVLLHVADVRLREDKLAGGASRRASAGAGATELTSPLRVLR